MGYLVTGGGGFIGRQLLEQLLQRSGTIYLLCANDADEQRLQPLVKRWPKRLVLMRADITLDPTFRTRFMNKSAGIEGRERR